MMLDCKMTSTLSPTTPSNTLSDCYGIWEQAALNPVGGVMKLEPMDILEFMHSSLTSPTTTSPMSTTTTTNCNNPGGLTLNHNNGSNRDYHFQNLQYLTPLPSLGNDSYATPECQMLDSFHSLGNIDSSFHKFSEACSSFSDSYENFMPDMTPIHTNHSQGVSQGQSQIHSLSENGDLNHPSLIPNSFSMNEQLSFTPQHLYSSHHEYMLEDFGCDPGEYFFLRKQESPTTSDSISYPDVDSEVDSKSSGESLETLKSRIEIRAVSPPKRRVGRPPKKDKKMKRLEKRTGRLWEFIRDLLKNPDYCPSLVRWENPDEGHFRFVNSEKVAQLWGQIKGNPRMTYEKLSRAMRYYYKSHVFEPVLGRRLVYKFGCNAVNWRPVNPNFVQKLYS